MTNSKSILLFFICILLIYKGNTQNYLSTNGQAIINEKQDTILLRGMGLGGWMIQEGYMLQTAGFANPQHEIRSTISALIGEADTELFYEAWLDNHVQKSDIDSLKSWGFNSVRLPMHYNLFTLPIEKEPIFGQDTWLDKGFELTDKLVAWCKENEMYVILDMHAAPGGQGYDEGISDYDPLKPSLWESNENKRKLEALWTRIAKHYAEEEWVAGYDLLNEPNWDLPGGNALRSLYQNITQSIRQVDPRHIIFIEGNWFANDFTGLTPPWDDNLVYSPHKYWSNNDVGTMQWVLDLRNTYNVPLYLGESGENSNVWFRDAIELLESLDIGWAWWPMKKIESIAGPLSVVKTEDYQSLLDYWNGTGSKPSPVFARATLMDLTEKLKTANCVYQKDVIDAMFRQIYSQETHPYKRHKIPGIIHATDYDLGAIGQAYYDNQSANYQVSTGNFTPWNDGWQYRNDGVDIEQSLNTINSNGYNVGFTDAGEWMQYEVNIEKDGVYDAHIRYSSASSGGCFHFAMDGASLAPRTFLDPTGDWQSWQTVVVPNIILDNGVQKLRFITDVDGYNVASFEFVNTDINMNDLPMIFVGGTTVDELTMQLSTNKNIDSTLVPKISDFEVQVDGLVTPITDVSIKDNNAKIINIAIDQILNYTDNIRVSYIGTELFAVDGTLLTPFNLEPIRNSLNRVHQIPSKIQAEDYDFQSGIVLENTTDIGGGQNIAYLDVNDYLEYRVNITKAGAYKIDYRTAGEFGTGGIELQLINESDEITIIDNTTFTSTGGWQSWNTTSKNITLPQGRYIMRMIITQAPFNMNWFSFDKTSSNLKVAHKIVKMNIFPNPSMSHLVVNASLVEVQSSTVEIYDMLGSEVYSKKMSSRKHINTKIDIEHLSSGPYLIKIVLKDKTTLLEPFIKI